jgi:hypothetical protein
MTCSLSAVALELPRSVHHVCCALRRSTHFFRWCAMVCVCALAPVPGSRPRVLVKPPLLRADVPHVSIAPCPRWKCRTVAQVPTRAVRHPWRPQHRGGRARSQPLSRGRTCSYRDMQIAYIQKSNTLSGRSVPGYLESREKVVFLAPQGHRFQVTALAAISPSEVGSVCNAVTSRDQNDIRASKAGKRQDCDQGRDRNRACHRHREADGQEVLASSLLPPCVHVALNTPGADSLAPRTGAPRTLGSSPSSTRLAWGV